jgi:hypothetical protein
MAAGEIETSDEADQPPLILQRAGAEIGQALGGGGDEPAAHRRLRRSQGGLLDLLADRFEGRLVTAVGQAGQH